MLPIEVMQKAQAEFLDYNNMGASVIEISHRSKEFGEIIDRSDALLRELADIPSRASLRSITSPNSLERWLISITDAPMLL